MNIIDLYSIFQQYPLISTDSRNIIPKSIFFALKGESFDGNKYAVEAIEKGAAYAVVDDVKVNHPKCILVESVLNALQELANYHRKQLKAKVIGITGTNGKTTTKELTLATLSKKFKTVATKGNLNNHIGVPLTLLSVPVDTEIAIIEMGANHIGEIAQLCSIAEPYFGIINNIGKAHLEGFGSFEGVITAKTEMYRYLNNKKNGIIFYNAINPLLVSEVSKVNCQKIGFGDAAKSEIYGEIVEVNPTLVCKIHCKGSEGIVKTNLTGSYNLENILTAITIAMYMGVSFADACEAIAEYVPQNNRSQIVEKSYNTVLCDYYNANPVSVEAALRNFAMLKIGKRTKKVAILGEMKELGNYSADEHAKIVDLLSEMNFSEVYLVGSSFIEAAQKTAFKTFENTSALVDYIRQNPIKDAMVLVKGSRAMKLELTLEVL